VYSSAIERRDFTPANFLGLAELRLESGDASEAVALLRRMASVAGNPFQNLVDAGRVLADHGHPVEAREFFSERVKAVPWDLNARLLLGKAELAANQNNTKAVQLLEGLAVNPQADYGLRIQAAEVLAPLHVHSQDLGSSELNLLATGQSIGAQAASQPFFVQARIEAAAHTGNPEERMPLLREAIAVKPEDASARIEFFRAAHKIGHDQLAISAMEPLITPTPYNYQPVTQYRRWAPRFTIAELGGVNDSSFITQSQLSPTQKSVLARDIAHAYEKLDNFDEARRYLRIAASLEPSEPVKAEIEKESRGITAKVNLLNRDAQRRPFVSGQLEQRNVVRPRVLPIVQQKSAGRISP
jgi:tetratricopeptide (TPR) repeat protein